MNDEPIMPPVVDRAPWQAELDALRLREKAHTREGDAIAAARRRLPIVEVDATLPLVGEDGPVTLLETFEGRRQLIALTVYARQETWEDSPAGWPQPWSGTNGNPYRSNGRPIAQWSRLEPGRSDDLGTGRSR